MSSTATKEGRLSLSYEPNVSPQSGRSTLQSQVQQIIAQRGAFRNLNAESLRKEVAQPEASPVEQEDVLPTDEDEETDEETAQARQERLWKSRDEMLQKLSYAQNEILSALDFVSLLLSNHSRAAQASMSPALTAVVQPGTLDAKVGETKQLSTKTKARLSKVSDGWKSESFKTAATKLEKGAIRLNVETAAQGKYWEQIAHLKAQGWAVSRLPADSRAIGVHFGFSESAPQFRNRGFALLQQDDKGNLELDSRLGLKQSGSVRFIVIRNGIETGSYSGPLAAASSTPYIHSQLLQARDSLFEEELFYEINREARLVANQNVQTHTQVVEAFISQGCSIRIVQTGSRQHDGSAGPDDQLAQFVGLGSRFLLTVEHSRLHIKRSQSPPPMTFIPPVRPEYAILRPIITHLRHQDAVAQALKLCDAFSPPFEYAGIPFNVHVNHDLTNLSNDAVLQTSALCGPARSSVVLTLATGNSVSLTLETFLGSPLYGTVFRSSDIEYPFTHLPPSELQDLDEVRVFLEQILRLEVVCNIQAVAKEQSNSGYIWSLAQVQSGELLVNKGIQKVAKAYLSAEAGKLVIGVVRIGKQAHTQRSAFMWNEHGCWSSSADGQSEPTSKTLKEVIVDLDNTL